ncbi:MAG TPA: ATP-binding protein [Candidatus Deferrimicrobium sp.]|nr:ATP-binding protein [Candidatus Deferrimicrobium sp.]
MTLLRDYRRPDRLSAASVCLAAAAVAIALTSSLAHPEKPNTAYLTALGIGVSLLPALWLWLTAVWGRDIQGESFFSRIKRGLVGSIVGVAVTAAVMLSGPVFEYVPDDLNAACFQMADKSFFIFLTYLTAFLFGLYNIDNTYRSALGVVQGRLRVGVFLLAVLTGVVFFVATLAIIYDRLALWVVLVSGVLCTVSLLGFGWSLIRNTPDRRGVVVTRRSGQTSTVIIVGAAYFLSVGVLSKVMVASEFAPHTLVIVIAGLLVLALLLAVVLSGLRGGTGSGLRRWQSGLESVRLLIDDISIHKTVEEIVDRLGVSLQSGFGISEGAFLEHVEAGKVAVYPFCGNASRVEHDHLPPLFEWLHRWGQPILFGDLAERCAGTDADCRFLGECVGFAPALVHPVVGRQKTMGVLVLGTGASKATETSALISFLETVGGPLALAIQNSRTTDQLLRAREMESFHRVSSFVLHDLKNSVGMLDLLLANARKNMDNPEFRRSMLGTIGDAVLRQRRIISRLSEPADGDSALRSELDINEVLRQVIDKAQVRKIERIELIEDYGQIPHVHTEPQTLASVFENLIVNAVEAMPVAGKLHVRTDLIGQADGTPRVTVSIRDTGRGMSRDFLETKLFQPFVSTKRKGMGIGLYQSYEAVRQLGGELKAVSEEGHGSTFEVVLPV